MRNEIAPKRIWELKYQLFFNQVSYLPRLVYMIISHLNQSTLIR